MKAFSFLQGFFPHLLVLLSFLIITFIYFSPVLEGKTLVQPDVVRAKGAATEIKEYYEKTGRLPMWTNSMFAGMPSVLIWTDFPNSWGTKLGRFILRLLPEPSNFVVLYLLGFYILLIALGFSHWLAALGAIAFAFGSYNFLNIVAGHNSKVIAIGFLPPTIAGVVLAFRGRYWQGGALSGLFLALHLYGNHIQITYYLFLTLALYVVFELVYALKEKRLKTYFRAVAMLTLSVGLAFGSHASRLMTTSEYSKESSRGESQLTFNNGQTKKGGMDKDYAFHWSYGKLETFTLLIPNLFGGSSAGSLAASSSSYQAILQQGGSREQARQFTSQLPLYWGSQPTTFGPAYGGAIVCFLFVLSMFIVKDRLKWWLLASILLLISFAWGKHFFLNDILFNYFPFFNKFRAVTMTLTLVQVFLALGAVLALREVVEGNYTWGQLKKPLLWSLSLTGGVTVVFILLTGLVFDFSSAGDARLKLPDWLLEAIREDRQSLLRSDGLRSLIFILMAAALLLAYLFKRVNEKVLYLSMSLLILLDLYSVDKRYLNNKDFVARRNAEKVQPTEADLAIKQDTTQYRVLNLTVNPFEDGMTSYFHHSIGGYHAAKLKRFQEVSDSVLFTELNRLVSLLQSQSFSPASLGQLPVLNMLNTKYFILGNQAQAVLQNPQALGNAWFVTKYNIVPNANAELEALKNFDPAQIAIVNQSYHSMLDNQNLQPDTTASILLTAYSPDKLSYQSKAVKPQLAVFSEVYYQGKNDWQAYLDGKPVEHIRANYLLRAMIVPAGSHKIEFIYRAHTYQLGEIIDLICSILLFSLVGVSMVLAAKQQKSRQTTVKITL